MQMSGSSGFMIETLKLPLVERRGERQDLQCYPAAERDLLSLVNDAHASPADLANDTIVAELSQTGVARSGRRCRIQRSHIQCRFVQEIQTGQACSERLSEVRVLGEQLFGVWPAAVFQLF